MKTGLKKAFAGASVLALAGVTMPREAEAQSLPNPPVVFNNLPEVSTPEDAQTNLDFVVNFQFNFPLPDLREVRVEGFQPGWAFEANPNAPGAIRASEAFSSETGGYLAAMTPTAPFNGNISFRPNFTPPANDDRDVALTITANMLRTADGASATASQTATIIVDAVADAPNVSAGNVTGVAGAEIPLQLAAALVDTDGSESLSVRVGTLPAGVALTSGTSLGNGEWELTKAEVDAGVALVTQPDFTGVINLTAAATATENPTDLETDLTNNTATSNAGFDVTVEPAPLPVCANGVDDDGDGLTDGQDVGCIYQNISGTEKSSWSALPCDNGIDDDGDGLMDFPSDLGCGSVASPTESPKCSDGIDNDDDGLIDASDPGCFGPSGATESPQCSDGIDNDNDGAIDMDDRNCTAPSGTRESPRASCGLGAEVALILPALAALRSRRKQGPKM